MNKTQFCKNAPRTRKEFVNKFNSDYVFRNNAKSLGFNVVADLVIFPNGKVANARVR